MKQKSHGTSARYEQPQPPKGLSGYDPEDKDMRGVFMARGPGLNVIGTPTNVA